MQKRYVVVLLAVLMAGIAIYGLAQMTEAGPVVEAVEAASPVMMRMTTQTAHVPTPSTMARVKDYIGDFSDTTMLVATGIALIGLAAGVRRQTY
jgi:hypothetical protein